MTCTLLTNKQWHKLKPVCYNLVSITNTIKEADAEWVFIDGSYVKAHQYACHVAHKTEQGIGKSVDGNTTKIHLMVDACGNLVDFIITGGQVHDIKVAPRLIEQNKQVLSKSTETLSIDKGYDCDELRK